MVVRSTRWCRSWLATISRLAASAVVRARTDYRPLRRAERRGHWVEKGRGVIVTGLVAAGYFGSTHSTPWPPSVTASATILRVRSLIRVTPDVGRSRRPVVTTTAWSSVTRNSEALKALARTHENVIWSRQRQVNVLRSSLEDYYPGALKTFGAPLANRHAREVLVAAPTPQLGQHSPNPRL